jgi:WhiB family redox-sensing transcriptional regulator
MGSVSTAPEFGSERKESAVLPVQPSSPPAALIITDIADWRAAAACRGIESSVFFSPDAERGQARTRRESRARRICQDCPVLRRCRDHALATDEPYGIWGGMTEADRRRHARRRDELRSLPPRHARHEMTGSRVEVGSRREGFDSR